jgi:hypothetical protein
MDAPPQAFESRLDNLFLRSQVALAWVIGKLSTENESNLQTLKTPEAKEPRITDATIALYRKIVEAGDKLVHGRSGKRKRLANDFSQKITRIAPDVDAYIFVKRAFAYCSKHPPRSKHR